MTLILYNTLSRREEPFTPLIPGIVSMYCCGITVYDYCHLGHARTCVVWDVVRRYLEYLGYKVRYIQNFTDIDDKILNRAKNEHTTMAAVAEKFIQAYFEDMEKLGVRPADAYPRATHTLDGIKRLVYELEQKGYAYPSDGGWHIECSAMVKEQLGETIDIHVGGSDLIFPHHENEIAQSEAATGKPLAHYWLHNGMVKVAGEKMSKSLGNFITIRELLAKYDPLAVRLLILGAQYRKPIDFSDEGLQAATNGWHTLQEGLSFGYKHLPPDNPGITDQELENRFQEAVNHDFNFAGGLAVLFEIAKELRKEGNNLTHAGKTDSNLAQLAVKWHTLVKLSRVLGLEIAADQGETPVSEGISAADIENLIQQRTEAKKAKNYAESDRIRAELKAQGITLIDQPGGVTKWLREGD